MRREAGLFAQPGGSVLPTTRNDRHYFLPTETCHEPLDLVQRVLSRDDDDTFDRIGLLECIDAVREQWAAAERKQHFGGSAEPRASSGGDNNRGRSAQRVR